MNRILHSSILVTAATVSWKDPKLHLINEPDVPVLEKKWNYKTKLHLEETALYCDLNTTSAHTSNEEN